MCTGPSNPPIASDGGSHLGPISAMEQNALPGAAFCKGTLCSGTDLSPKATWLRETTLAFFSPSPLLSFGQRSVLAASGPELESLGRVGRHHRPGKAGRPPMSPDSGPSRQRIGSTSSALRHDGESPENAGQPCGHSHPNVSRQRHLVVPTGPWTWARVARRAGHHRGPLGKAQDFRDAFRHRVPPTRAQVAWES